MTPNYNRRKAIVLSLILLGQMIVAPRSQAASKPFFFIQIADTQFGFGSHSALDFQQETANNEFIVATINRLQPAFVVICGDLINNSMNPEQTREFKRVMAQVNPSIHVYSVPGNHDVDGTQAALNFYTQNFGPDQYVFREQTLEGVVLDSALIAEPEKMPALALAQDEWLRTSLAKAKAEGIPHILVFQHIPWFISDVDEEDHYYNLPKVRRRSYLDLMAASGVQAILSGHAHCNILGQYKSIQLITTGAAGGQAFFGSRSGLTVVVVRELGLEERYYDLGWIPNQIDPEKPLPAPPPPGLPH